MRKLGKTKISPRPELIKEFKQTGQQILILSPDSFLHYAKKFDKVRISDNAVEETKRVSLNYHDKMLDRPEPIFEGAGLSAINPQLKPDLTNQLITGGFGQQYKDAIRSYNQLLDSSIIQGGLIKPNISMGNLDAGIKKIIDGTIHINE